MWIIKPENEYLFIQLGELFVLNRFLLFVKGPPGLNGDPGDPGPIGISLDGPVGTPGLPGLPGSKGTPGDVFLVRPGATGPPGYPGAVGAKGHRGIPGSPGSSGKFHLHLDDPSKLFNNLGFGECGLYHRKHLFSIITLKLQVYRANLDNLVIKENQESVVTLEPLVSQAHPVDYVIHMELQVPQDLQERLD